MQLDVLASDVYCLGSELDAYSVVGLLFVWMYLVLISDWMCARRWTYTCFQ